ncbi:hypothetical protein Glove_629g7 [Diversispora epigaea]|uniref:Uncharacterized protein n=1 Tax=Diversispora epigaea TaxID=1348612 RepID=A0A397G865_9GLOM|nr:hypothetical protein Glove_629g7 [Diversispora epigaea]
MSSETCENFLGTLLSKILSQETVETAEISRERKMIISRSQRSRDNRQPCYNDYFKSDILCISQENLDNENNFSHLLNLNDKETITNDNLYLGENSYNMQNPNIEDLRWNQEYELDSLLIKNKELFSWNTKDLEKTDIT